MSLRMMRLQRLLLVCLCAAPVAHAQFAVIDVGAIAQLVQQAQTLGQQLTTTGNQLTLAQSELASMSGGRGMERLLGGTTRNYLPSDWPTLQSAMQGGAGGFGALSSGILVSTQSNAVLSAQQLAGLPTAVQQQIQAARELTALSQNVSRQALSMTSRRFASLQQLIDAIPSAADQKGVLDLQARVAAENAMLQNEQTKLQSLAGVIVAEERATQQQFREQALAGHGAFASRFQPSP
ncbi:MAG TPA: type IV secretion system protein [Steroidobacteraceae bacterium]